MKIKLDKYKNLKKITFKCAITNNFPRKIAYLWMGALMNDFYLFIKVSKKNFKNDFFGI